MILKLIELGADVYAWRRVSNGGIVVWSSSGERRLLLIDTGSEEGAVNGLLAVIDRLRPHRVFIVNTHQHRDHAFGNKLLRRQADAKLWTPIGANAEQRAEINWYDLNDLMTGVIPVPGHTEDSKAYVVATALFAGDAVYTPEVLRRFPIPAYADVAAALSSLDLLGRTFRQLLAGKNDGGACWLVAGHGRPLANNEGLRAITRCIIAVQAALQLMESISVPGEPLTEEQVADWLNLTGTPVRPDTFPHWVRVADAYRKELERIKRCAK